MNFYSVLGLIFCAAAIVYVPALLNRGKKRERVNKLANKAVISHINIVGIILFFSCACYSSFYVFVYFKEDVPKINGGLSLFLLAVGLAACIFYYKKQDEQV